MSIRNYAIKDQSTYQAVETENLSAAVSDTWQKTASKYELAW